MTQNGSQTPRWRLARKVPDGEGKRQRSQRVSDECKAAGVDMPAAPEGYGGGEQHHGASNGLHKFN